MKGIQEICGKHLAVVVPHQDDEILMCAGLIRHAVKQRILVDVVMVTNGDYGCSDQSVGRARLQESVKGLALLGVPAEHFHILGYADTGMPEAESFLTHLYQETDPEKIYPSFCGEQTYGLEEQDESHFRRYGTHALYCRTNLKSDLIDVFRELQADTIVTTADSDVHGDHSALYRFVCEVLDELADEPCGGPAVLAGLVHSRTGDEYWPSRTGKVYENPGECLPEGHTWEERICIPVPEDMRTELGDQNLKYRALLQYETALEPGAYDFLMSFIKNEEVFWQMR